MKQRMRGPVIAALLMGLVASLPASAAGSSHHWYASWTASPFDSRSMPRALLTPSSETISNQTVRQIVTLSRGGSELRVRFSNEYAAAPLHIGAASIGFQGANGTVRQPLTFGGANSVTAAAGAPIVSDPVAIAVSDGASIEISIYLPDRTPLGSFHLLALQPNTVSAPGNFVMADTLPGATVFGFQDKISNTNLSSRVALSEIDVAGPKPIRTVVAFGDSITDGMGSADGANQRWPDFLARRIVKAKLDLAVVNQGIGGNQLLSSGMGDSALARFDRDVLALPGVQAVIILEGINDLSFSQNFMPPNANPDVIHSLSRVDLISAEELIQGYRQLIARAHARGLRVIGATLTPFAGAPAYTPEKETVRQAVNTWIRTSGAFDGVADFDKVTRDAQNPAHLLAAFDSGDHIHLNSAGYEAMANVVDLKQL